MAGYEELSGSDQEGVCAVAMIKLRDNWRGIPEDPQQRKQHINGILDDIAQKWPEDQNLADAWHRLNSTTISAKDAIAKQLQGNQAEQSFER